MLYRFLFVPVFLLTMTAPATAQIAPDPPATAQVAPDPDTATLSLPSPRGAFLRSLAVPGWGQAYAGSYTRGGFYFAAQGASWYMLLKTIAKLNIGREIEQQLVRAVQDSVLAETGVSPALIDPRVLSAAVDQNPDIETIRSIVSSREAQREDWIAWVLFWTLASGVDAFVGAHLADFPAGVSANRRATGGFDLQFTVPVGRRR